MLIPTKDLVQTTVYFYGVVSMCTTLIHIVKLNGSYSEKLVGGIFAGVVWPVYVPLLWRDTCAINIDTKYFKFNAKVSKL